MGIEEHGSTFEDIVSDPTRPGTIILLRVPAPKDRFTEFTSVSVAEVTRALS